MSVPQGIDPGELSKDRCEAFRDSHALRRNYGRLHRTREPVFLVRMNGALEVNGYCVLRPVAVKDSGD